jgi:hypothetical protein
MLEPTLLLVQQAAFLAQQERILLQVHRVAPIVQQDVMVQVQVINALAYVQ